MYKLQLLERLINAVEMGDVQDVVTCMRQGADINDVPWGAESLLMRAIRCKHEAVATILINNGIDVNYVYVKADSPRGDGTMKQETAKDYAVFYDLPKIVELIEAKQKKSKHLSP